jgi:hypothetical protein
MGDVGKRRSASNWTELRPTAVGWTGGQKQKGKEGWSAGQARLMNGDGDGDGVRYLPRDN